MPFLNNMFLEKNLCMDNYDYLTNTLLFFSISQFGILFSLLFVSIFVYKPYMNKLKNTLNDRILDDEPPLYEDKYPLENYKNFTNDNINNNSYIIDYTPEGNVIMKYDNQEEGFVYWCDKSIAYKNLQTVARKYVIQNGCVNLYKGYEYEPEEQEQEEQEQEQEKKEEEIQEKKIVEQKPDVFANLKKYSNDKQTNKPTILIEKNKFIHKGRFNEISILKPVILENQKSNMSFEDFKKLQS